MNSIAESAAWPDAFIWRIRVYFEDTDMGGIVFYANYLKYFERARTEWLRACGVGQRALTEAHGTMFVVRGTALDYHAPARLDDWVEIETQVGRIGRASVDFEQRAWCEGKLLAGGTIRVGCVDRATMKPAAIPSDTFAALNVGPKPGLKLGANPVPGTDPATAPGVGPDVASDVASNVASDARPDSGPRAATPPGGLAGCSPLAGAR